MLRLTPSIFQERAENDFADIKSVFVLFMDASTDEVDLSGSGSLNDLQYQEFLA